MPLRVDADACVLCGRCLQECPLDALVERDGKVVVTDDCTLCGICRDVCPVEAIAVEVAEAGHGRVEGCRGVWVLAGAALVVRCVLLPAARRMGGVALAASVERAFPELGERLTSSVSLTAADDPYGHLGSPALKEAVVDQATRQALGLRFSQAYPSTAARRRGLALLLVLLPLVVVTWLWLPTAIGVFATVVAMSQVK